MWQIYINNGRWLFWGQFWLLLNQSLFLEAAGAESKIDTSLKLNHHYEIKLAKFVKHSVEHISKSAIGQSFKHIWNTRIIDDVTNFIL